MTPGGAKQKLPNIHCAAAYISAYQVCIHGLKVAASEYPAGKDAIAKSGSETFNLALDSRQHVEL